MRILLVKLAEPTRPGQKACYMPPLGLWSLRAALRADGETCEVIDMHLGDEIEGEWDVIGISAQFSIQHAEYERVAKIAAEHADEVVAGGFHAAAVAAPDGVAQVCDGPGEDFFDVEYRPPDMTEDELLRYWQHEAPHDLQSATSRWMSIETSRGCNYGCGYCGVSRFWGKWRPLDISMIRGHLGNLRDNLGVQELFIEDDNATTEGHLERLLPDLRTFKWSMPNGVRIADLSIGLIRRMAKSGCWRISLPFETGALHTARQMYLGDKWVPYPMAKAIVEIIRDAGIRTCGFFIIGYPGEGEAEAKLTLEYANSLPLDDRHIYIATPYPGTKLYETCIKNGWLTTGPPELYDALMYNRALIRTPWFEPERIELMRAVDRAEAMARKLGG